MIDHNGHPDPITGTSRVALACWPRLLSVKLLASYLSVAEQTVRNRQDEIPGLLRMGRSVRWDRAIIDQWVAEAQAGADLFGKTLDNRLAAR